MMLPVVILCGGLGTRLGPLTKDKPKSLVDVHGEPFLVHQLRLLRAAGVEEVFLMVHHLGHQLVTGWDRSLVRPMRVHCINAEYCTPLGTAGCIRRSLPRLPRAFFTLYGDSYLECDYAAIERRFWDRGKLGLRTEWQRVDYGVSVFFEGAFIAYPPVWDIPQLHKQLASVDQLEIMTMPEKYEEIGSLAGLERVRQRLRSRAADVSRA